MDWGNPTVNPTLQNLISEEHHHHHDEPSEEKPATLDAGDVLEGATAEDSNSTTENSLQHEKNEPRAYNPH